MGTEKNKGVLSTILKDIDSDTSNPSKDSSTNISNKPPVKKKGKIATVALQSLSEELNNKKYIKTSNVFIDKDVHEVFTLLKKHKKISIGALLSYLGEKFIDENQDEIIKINKNKNKYLKK